MKDMVGRAWQAIVDLHTEWCRSDPEPHVLDYVYTAALLAVTIAVCWAKFS